MNIIAIIGGVLQIIAMVLKNKFERDADEKKRKDELHAEWKETVSSGDINRINDMLNRMRS